MPVDCLLQDLSKDNNRAKPPWRLLTPLVRLIKEQKATATVIAPFFPRQWWFNELREMSIDLPIELPRDPTTFMSGASGHVEPSGNPKWRCFAFRISGSRTTPTLSPKSWDACFA